MNTQDSILHAGPILPRSPTEGSTILTPYTGKNDTQLGQPPG